MKESVNNQSANIFDFLFIGLGAANCLLILRLNENGLLKGKTLAIIEPSGKIDNDRTFCFWATNAELNALNIKSLVSYNWENIEIIGVTKQYIKPLSYFHVKGLDLYNETKNILFENNVTTFTTFFNEKPAIKENHFEIYLENETIKVNKVFDSRPPVFLNPKKNETHLYQSFYGWKIKTSKKQFDSSTMIMMDFNIPQNNYTQFVYTLPFDEETALIELTRFGDKRLIYEEAQIILEEYVKRLNVSFEILDHEQGVIPMSSAIILVDNFGSNWINMGARANMLKSTTGYAFHSMAEDALVQMEAIKNNKHPKRKGKRKRFIFYDRLLLKILAEKPSQGKIIFETLFRKVHINKVLSFLREKTTITEEIIIFSKLQKLLFIKTALKDLQPNLTNLPIVVLPFVFTLLTTLFSISNFENISIFILGLGFFTVGLSHGALDHLTVHSIETNKHLLRFIINFTLKCLILGFLWVFFSDLALIIFILFSAWHFGQADFKEWKLNKSWLSFLWGINVLFVILFFHFQELKSVLIQIPNLTYLYLLNNVSNIQLLYFQILIAFSGVILALVNKSKYIIYTLSYLIVSSMLPLLVSFGIYFVFQHSIHGWKHIQISLNKDAFSLWLKSLPFSIVGAVIILLFLLFASQNFIGIFFIILSCLSFPHVLSMHHFYLNSKINSKNF